ncbi:MAG TPA: GNAT family N-acetyltransferase [Micromonosporaceae bacterium]
MSTIRQLTPDDWQVWRALRLAALTEAPYAFGSRLGDHQGDNDQEERWRERLELPGSYNLAAYLNGRPVGMVRGVPTDDADVVGLFSMWVDPAARGHRVGDDLVAAVLTWARDRGAGAVCLHVAEDNEAAIRLYRRHGFAFTGEAELMPDGQRRELAMSMTLRATDRP